MRESRAQWGVGMRAGRSSVLPRETGEEHCEQATCYHQSDHRNEGENGRTPWVLTHPDPVRLAYELRVPNVLLASRCSCLM